MIQYIAHRVNTAEELANIPEEYGVELDLRDSGNDLILAHDPFQQGEPFDAYLANYRHRTLILNIKSERIEPRILDAIKKHQIRDYFFLDCSFPMIYQLSEQGERQIAVRYSEFEPPESVLQAADRVKWVWVDCFTRLPITKEIYQMFKDKGLKICLVSPELQGREQDIEPYAEQLNQQGIIPDAICTKLHNIPRWNKTIHRDNLLITE